MDKTEQTFNRKQELWITLSEVEEARVMVIVWVILEARKQLAKWRAEQLPIIRY